MKKFVLAALVSSACLGSPAFAGVQDFSLINGTGKTIERVFVSASSKDNWEEDVLGEDVLLEGGRSKIRFNSAEDSCLWDIRVTYPEGDTADWHGINLCEVSVVKLTQDDEGDTYAETE